MREIQIAVTRFVADDDAEFADADKCRLYETLLAQKAAMWRHLGKDDTAREDRMRMGRGYVQLAESDMDSATAILAGSLKLVSNELAHAFAINPKGLVGRYLDDGCGSDDQGRIYRILYAMWSELLCVDGENRRWDQPYFALNPNPSASAL